MPNDDEIADDLIPASLKRSASYHADYGRLTYGTIRDLAATRPADRKAAQTKTLIEQSHRLREKLKRKKP